MENEKKPPEMGVTQAPKTPKQLKDEFVRKYQELCREYGYAISGKTILEVVEV